MDSLLEAWVGPGQCKCCQALSVCEPPSLGAISLAALQMAQLAQLAGSLAGSFPKADLRVPHRCRQHADTRMCCHAFIQVTKLRPHPALCCRAQAGGWGPRLTGRGGARSGPLGGPGCASAWRRSSTAGTGARRRAPSCSGPPKWPGGTPPTDMRSVIERFEILSMAWQQRSRPCCCTAAESPLYHERLQNPTQGETSHTAHICSHIGVLLAAVFAVALCAIHFRNIETLFNDWQGSLVYSLS